LVTLFGALAYRKDGVENIAAQRAGEDEVRNQRTCVDIESIDHERAVRRLGYEPPDGIESF